MAKSIYQRLTGRKRTLLGYSQLWLAPDHILLVKSTHFAESYQRFALTDIQAIVVTETPLGCRCYLHTAVSRELLAPVSRLRSVRKFLARVRPAIEAAQGNLPAQGFATPEQSHAPPVGSPPPGVVRAPGVVPEVLFGLFLLDAALVFLPYPEAGMVLLTAFFAEIVLAVMALARRGARDPRRIAYAVVIIGLLCMAGDVTGLARAVAGWVTRLVEAARQGTQTPPHFSWAYSHGAALFAAGWRLAAGMAGLAASFLERRAGETT
jgi:hypothetical protein